jgi:hypothetical protein
MLQQSFLMFGDTLFGKALNLLRHRRVPFAHCDFRFATHHEPAPCSAGTRAVPTVNKRFTLSRLLPPTSGARMRSARLEIAALLDDWPGGRRMQPSLALIERALYKDGGQGIDEISPCVLRHAAASLDVLDPLRMGPGLVELRRRIGLLLRRLHGGHLRRSDEPDKSAPPRERAFEDSLTELIELDALMGECHS